MLEGRAAWRHAGRQRANKFNPENRVLKSSEYFEHVAGYFEHVAGMGTVLERFGEVLCERYSRSCEVPSYFEDLPPPPFPRASCIPTRLHHTPLLTESGRGAAPGIARLA